MVDARRPESSSGCQQRSLASAFETVLRNDRGPGGRDAEIRGYWVGERVELPSDVVAKIEANKLEADKSLFWQHVISAAREHTAKRGVPPKAYGLCPHHFKELEYPVGDYRNAYGLALFWSDDDFGHHSHGLTLEPVPSIEEVHRTKIPRLVLRGHQEDVLPEAIQKMILDLKIIELINKRAKELSFKEHQRKWHETCEWTRLFGNDCP